VGVLVLVYSMYLLPIVKTPTTSVFPSYVLQHHQFNLHYRYLILLVRAKDGRTYDTIGELSRVLQLTRQQLSGSQHSSCIESALITCVLGFAMSH
jgi:hypothetical protein